MGIKTVHIFFITVSALMFFGLAVWRGSVYSDEGSMSALGEALGSALAGVGLVIYGVQFLRKLKGIGYL
jgi:hypothetical protein